MSTSPELAGLLDDAVEVYRRDRNAPPIALADVERCARRLREPLRIALAGALKAGKSTLLNALIGEELAPTAATECTTVVTWFRHGTTPSVQACHVNGQHAAVPIERRDAHLNFDLGRLDPAELDRLEVSWPTPELNRVTIIDTPGTTSLNAEISRRTLRLLAPEDGTSGADAVVYLMRTSTAADYSTLAELNRQVGGRGGPLGVIGVLSRADEIGVGRIDAMLSAQEIAARYAGELSASGLCQAVVPVAGLLAVTARTLRQREFTALRALAEASADDLQLAMLSVDRFSRENSPLPVPADVRVALLNRFGIFGIRIAIALLQGGVPDAATLSAQLLERSGIVELRERIEVQFGQRAEQLKAHSALTELARILTRHPVDGTAPILAATRRLLGDVHGFEEVRLLGRLRSCKTSLTDSEIVEVTRLIGGYGASPDDRLGLDPFEAMTSGRDRALAAVQRWRARSGHPLNDGFTTRVCRAAARSAEGIVAQMTRTSMMRESGIREPGIREPGIRGSGHRMR